MSARLLITGANGFIGRHVTAALGRRGLASNTEVLLLRHRSASEVAPNGMRWLQADLFDGNSIEALLKSCAPTHLMHLAWVTTPGIYLTTADNLRWLAASLDLVTQFTQLGGKHAVIAGTSFEYGLSESECREDQTADRPDSLYARSKKALYRLLPEVAGATGLKWAWARIFQVYGPGEPTNKLITAAIRQCLREQPVLCRTPLTIRDFVHVTDVAEGLVDMSRLEAEGAYNLATGQGLAIKDVLNKIAAEAEQGEIRYEDQAVEGTNRLVGDIRKAQRGLRWSPQMPLREGLRDMIRFERTCLKVADT